ncbi:hypothetical protein FHS04_000855 [Mesoflavibacter sabulilitoris]|uniref:Uncharacterized protein n=1 Tax=Mesoflavibacter zeaxanthinifaciens subsp. sabulilitoris TaxID=1520893 RepID=A0A2T1N5Z5_9FLAO|nr:hypothetical protein [Mesoflavibacter zeaxanthinifaciens]MBB3123358.1 hypothetical protein [Mesoflavibacter zeaxanthinifaciens subsp. sabulilitoris]PSG87009.1 hypothetical protein C7H61_12935 [Mesoflavibacter zeaxanthinifaciens subsp. sabulilitoris]
MRKKIFLTAALIAASFTTFAQVGVGTTDPKAGLDITSDKGMLLPRIADHTSLTPVDGTLDANEAGLQVYDTTTNKVMLWDGTAWVASATGTAKFVDGTTPADAVFTDGKVGIGIEAPSEQFHIYNESGAFSLLESNTSVAGLYIRTNNTNSTTLMQLNQGTDYWRTRFYSSLGPSGNSYGIGFNQILPSMFLIQSDGNIAIGQSSATQKLEIAGNAKLEELYYGGVIRDHRFSNKLILFSSSLATELHSAGSTGILFKDNANNELARISNEGNFGIGTTSPVAKLDVNGAIKVGDAVATPVAGMIAYGDKGSGIGFYGYTGGAWVKLH